MLKQKLEDSLRQRERELTALKGALKDEVATHDKDMETLREQYSTDMERLRSTVEQVSQVRTHARTHTFQRLFTMATGYNRWKTVVRFLLESSFPPTRVH
jgi:cingulin